MKIHVAVAVLPEYRANFHDIVNQKLSKEGHQVAWVAGDRHLDETVRSAPLQGVTIVRNRLLLGHRVLWQPRVALSPLVADVAVVDLNPRSAASWLALLIGKITRRRVLVWGHILPRKGEGAKTIPIRRFMRRLASGVISYTWSDAEIVRREDNHERVWVAANALYKSRDLGVIPNEHRTRILYVGRLEGPKKPLLAIDAFARIRESWPDARLTFIGSGSESAKIEDRIKLHSLGESVELLGHVSDVSKLRSLYSEAVFSISPGYAGLSLTQSLGFGVPMLVARSEPHAPEIELLDLESGMWFKSDDALDMAESMLSMRSSTWDRAHISQRVAHLYSAEAMANGFLAALMDEPASREGRERA